MSQLLLDIAPDYPPTLNNFVAGRNQELLAALRHALADNSRAGERCFYLWGETGSGKSHLLQACVQAALTIQSRPGGRSHKASGSAGVPPASAGEDAGAIYAQGYVPQCAAVVALDDVERLDDAAQIELFNLYNQMRDNGNLLLVGGQKSPLHLELRDDLRTRLGWGLVYQVHGLSDEEKIQALIQHAHGRGFALPLEVAQYLLRHGRRDLPSLLAALDALDEHSLRLHRAPSVPLLKEILQRKLELE